MNLNAAIIIDNLKGNYIIRSRVYDETLFVLNLCFPEIYDGDANFRDDRLYVVKAADLPEQPSIQKNATLLCIGEPKEIYWKMQCNIIALHENTRINYAMNLAVEIFRKYDVWSQTMQSLLLNNAPIKELGLKSMKIFENPIALHDKNHRSIFLCTDEFKPPLPEDALMDDNSCMPPEEINKIMMDPEYNALYSHREPVVYSDSIYNYKTLLQNIFLGDEFLGRICLYDIYRPFRKSDYALLIPFCSYIKSVLESSNLILEINPHKLEYAVNNLLETELYNETLFHEALAEAGWSADDVFACATFSTPSYIWTSSASLWNGAGADPRIELSPDIQKNCIVVRRSENLFMLLNITKSGLSKEQAIGELCAYFSKTKSSGGISSNFMSLHKLKTYYNQANAAFQYAKRRGWGSCELFDSHILEFIRQNCLRQQTVDSYIPDSLFALMQYDREKGTDYCSLLRIFLENNMNIADTIRIMYIHRNTFLYKIERIKKILGCDLNDYKVRLSLQIAFLLLDGEKK